MLSERQIKEATIAQETLNRIERFYPGEVPTSTWHECNRVMDGIVERIKFNDKQGVRELADPYLTSQSLLEVLSDQALLKDIKGFHSAIFRVLITTLIPHHFRVDLAATNKDYDKPKEHLAKGLLSIVK